MPTAARLNDKGTQHDDYYETVSIASSPTVFIDGLPVARMGDAVDCGGVVIL
ncbi:PAAR domain-containing protein [Salmonella enterica]|nr:PAAR domain-containing protein [Salmonella enterica]